LNQLTLSIGGGSSVKNW